MYLEDWKHKQPQEEMIEDKILLDTLCLDYITLTSYDTQLLEGHARHIVSRIPEHMPTAKNRMQYAGLICDGTFFGIGKQQEQRHAMLQVPGYRSWITALIGMIEPEDIRCSRFDIQITVDAALIPSMQLLYEYLDAAEKSDWNQTGPRPRHQLIRNSDGYDTLYIGTRTSELFRRIYVKNIEGRDYVRYEVECKGALARSLYARGEVTDREGLKNIFQHQFHALPSQLQRLLLPFLERVGQGTGVFIPVNRSSDEEKALEWFRGAVAPALDKARRRGYFRELCAIMAGEGYDISVRDEQKRMSAHKGKKGEQRDGICREG
jgi:hypothetical protein